MAAKSEKWKGSRTRNLSAKQQEKAKRIVGTKNGKTRTEDVTAAERKAAKSSVDIGQTKWTTAAERGGKGRGGLLTDTSGKAVTGTVTLPSGKKATYVRGKRIGIVATRPGGGGAGGGGGGSRGAGTSAAAKAAGAGKKYEEKKAGMRPGARPVAASRAANNRGATSGTVTSGVSQGKRQGGAPGYQAGAGMVKTLPSGQGMLGRARGGSASPTVARLERQLALVKQAANARKARAQRTAADRAAAQREQQKIKELQAAIDRAKRS